METQDNQVWQIAKCNLQTKEAKAAGDDVQEWSGSYHRDYGTSRCGAAERGAKAKKIQLRKPWTIVQLSRGQISLGIAVAAE